MRRILPIGNQTGFTLLELVLAMTIGGMVLSAVYSTFSIGIDTQRRVSRVATRTQTWRYFSERLRADIKNLLVDEETLIGERDNLTLNLARAEEVRYERRGIAGGGQVRRIVLDDDGKSGSETVVLEGANKLSFRYFIGGKWRDKSDENLPTAVECSVADDEGERRLVVSLEVVHAKN